MEQLTSRQKKGVETKRKIFECAIQLFSRAAYENITVNDICKAAEVSVGAFYHHFTSKENILNEGYRLFDEQLEEQWLTERPGDGVSSIRFLIIGQMNSMEKMGATAAAQYFKNQLTTEDKYILDKDRFFYRTIFQNVACELHKGSLAGDAAAITGDILSLSRGIIYDWCLHGGGYDLVSQGMKALAMTLRYYQPSSANSGRLN